MESIAYRSSAVARKGLTNLKMHLCVADPSRSFHIALQMNQEQK